MTTDAEIPALVARLSEADPVSRERAASTLSKLAEKGSKDARMLEPLARVLDDPDGTVRHAASTALGWLGYRGGVVDVCEVEPALRCLADEIDMVRHDAAWILESCAQRGIVDARAVPLLLGNVDHRNADVAAASLYCLAHLAKAGLLTRDQLRAAATSRAKDSDAGLLKAVKTALAVADEP